MKTIPNKRTTIEVTGTDGGVDLITYANLIKTIMQNRRPDGYSVDDMRKDFRVIDAIDLNADSITLEDADFEHLKTKIKGFRYGLIHKDIIQFEDDINAIK